MYQFGSTLTSLIIEEHFKTGKLSPGDYRKIGRTYQEYCETINALWRSDISLKVKRSLNNIIHQSYMKRCLDLRVDFEYQTRLQNLISSKHRKIAKEQGLVKHEK